jgi:hypothetical protein
MSAPLSFVLSTDGFKKKNVKEHFCKGTICGSEMISQLIKVKLWL